MLFEKHYCIKCYSYSQCTVAAGKKFYIIFPQFDYVPIFQPSVLL